MNFDRQQFARDVRAGLTHPHQRELPSKYFYDNLGSALFEAITELPEYGLTRADARLLERHAAEIAAVPSRGREGTCIVAELGSGSGKKTRHILRAANSLRYFPIDVSRSALATCAAELASEADVHPIEATYLDGLETVNDRRDSSAPLLLLFLGSTIGNFDLECAAEFLQAVRQRLRSGDYLLIGADLEKPLPQLLAAYDDPTGVTSAFNRNILGRINRELDGNFDLPCFAHEARYNQSVRRIEMHLRSATTQSICIRGIDLEFTMRAGETIWTESSHKFRPEDLDALAASANFEPIATWIDAEWPFAENLWSVR